MIVMWECPYGRIRTNQKTHYCQGCSDDVKRVYDTTYCYFRKTEKSMRNFNPIGFSDFPPIILGIQLVESLRDNPDVAFVLGKMMAFPRCPPAFRLDTPIHQAPQDCVHRGLIEYKFIPFGWRNKIRH